MNGAIRHALLCLVGISLQSLRSHLFPRRKVGRPNRQEYPRKMCPDRFRLPDHRLQGRIPIRKLYKYTSSYQKIEKLLIN